MDYLENVGNYIHRERRRETYEFCWLLVNFSGLKRMSVTLPSGRPLFSLAENREFAALVPAGSCCDFHYGEGRDNWVIELQKGIITESQAGTIELFWADMTVELCGFSPLETLQVNRSKEYLTRLLHDFHTPEHDRSISQHLAFCGLLDCVTDPMLHPPEIDDPAKALRDRIIADRHFVRSLSALSLKCGYSPDHLRALFVARYGVTPKAFRTDYRMRLARDLLSLGTLSVGDVAESLGYSHTAHFSTAFKTYFGHPPGQLGRLHNLET